MPGLSTEWKQYEFTLTTGKIDTSSENHLLLTVGHAGKVWIDISTVSPALSRSLAANVREKGSDMMDAPVSGSVITLQQGKLSVMVGGRAETFERVKPLLLELGPKVTHVGGNGLALSMKIASNLSLAVQMLAFSEGLLLAKRDGVEAHLAADVMAGSAIASPMLKARLPLVLDKPDEAWFDVALMHKDIRLALAAGDELNTPLPAAGAADQLLARATELGYEHRDIASIFQVLGRMAEESSRPDASSPTP